ncbi:MAG: AMP-binding protein [Clostridiaceae bacterium]|nr:AMP-binding protein [Clostridiaceae bacterium]
MNIYELIKKNNQNHPGKTALSIMNERHEIRKYTYAELFAEVDLLAGQLTGTGLTGGDRIALAAENMPEWNIALLAIHKISCTAVLLDATLLPADLVRQIDRSDVRCILASPRMIGKLGALVPSELPLLDLANHGEPYLSGPGGRTSLRPTPDGDETIAAIIFSSGTTRAAAGIMHSHESLIKSTLMCAENNHLTSEGKYLAVVPNSHIYGLICSVLGPMILGADVFFIEQNTPAALKAAFAEYKPTIFTCVPRIFELFKSEAGKKIAADSKTKRLFDFFFPICLSLRLKTGINLGRIIFKSIHQAFGGKIEIFCSAGAPMDKETADFYIGTGFNMLLTYGATETNIPTLGNRGRMLTTDSCGQPYPAVTVKISESGELLIKSPFMMKGYFKEPELTKQAFEDGWFKTGDLCQRNAQGNYTIIGRSKENIVLASGKKVIPEDLEKAYAAISGIKDMAICAVPAEAASYDEIHAFLVRNEQTADTDTIIQAIHERATELPSHMKIVQIHFIDEIPRTSMQKPKRYLLKKIAADENANRAAIQAASAPQEPVDIEQTVIRMIAEAGQLDRRVVTMDTKPFSSLGMDSLNAIELSIQIENQYGIRIDQSISKNMTVAELVALVKTPGAKTPDSTDASLYPQRKQLSDYRLFRHFCKLARFFYKITVSNDKVIPNDSGFILCANHVSNFDYLWLTINFTRQRFDKFCCMAKQELLNKSRFSRTLSHICGMIPVDRANVHIETMKCCQRQLKEQWGLLIHPEGTRSETGELGQFKKGAAVLAIETNVPIIPAYIHGAYDVYPKGSKLPKLFNVRKMRKYAVSVIYGNPIFPHGQTAEYLINQVKESILTLKSDYAKAH